MAIRCLLTGANGLLGQAFVANYGKDPEVILLGLGRRAPQGLSASIAYQVCDLLDKHALKAVLDSFQPDVVLHTAAATDVDWCEQAPQEAWAQNVLVVEHLASLLNKTQHIVLLSTDFVFDGTQAPYAENAPYTPCNHYGRTKQAAESCLIKSQLSYSILRTSLVYGYAVGLGRLNIVLWIIKALQAKQTLHMTREQQRMPTYVHDLAQACRAALTQTGIFHVAGAEVLSPYALACEVARVFDLDAGLIQVQNQTLKKNPRKNPKQVALRPLDTRLICDKARSQLSYVPRPIAKALCAIQKTLI